MICHQGGAVIQTIDLIGFLSLGLLGGFGHCAGMCAPFVMLVSRRFGAPPSRGGVAAAQLWYNAGRVATYICLGAAAGALGSVVQLAGTLVGLQRAATLVAGIVLVASALAALLYAGSGNYAASGLFTRVAARFKGHMPGHPFAVGLFLGLLPCGLVYSAMVAAVSRGGALQGGIALALFGIGTMAALLGVSLADQLLVRRRAFVASLSQAFILTMGVWFLWRGLAS